MKILFLTTAHNSLSQRLSLLLSSAPHNHNVTVELAISSEIMIEGVKLANPDLIICPFLTKRVPSEIYEKYTTLIVHPGPPGDCGPSAIDWFLLGDDGTEQDSAIALCNAITTPTSKLPATRYWAVTVLQAIEAFDEGPVYAFSQFTVSQGTSKSDLYRNQITYAACHAILEAIDVFKQGKKPAAEDKLLSTPDGKPWMGYQPRHRPLLKASERDFDPTKENADIVSRKLLCSNSQPGVLSSCLSSYLEDQTSLFLYGGMIEPTGLPDRFHARAPGKIAAQRDGALLLICADGKGVWITHVREPKRKDQKQLNPKVSAMMGCKFKCDPFSAAPAVWSYAFKEGKLDSWQDVWVEFKETTVAGLARLEGPRGEVQPDPVAFGDYYQSEDKCSIAYIHFPFYNGAASTKQSQRLLQAMRHAVDPYSAPNEHPLRALVLMGGDQFFSNGIHLSVIEAAEEPATEGWNSINAIDDVCEFLLSPILPARGILTFAALRGNAAAGGFALATCCDFVLCSQRATINPGYRAIGLHGSEFHTFTYRKRLERAGNVEARFKEMTRGLLPIDATRALNLGLVDHIMPFGGSEADHAVDAFVTNVLKRTLNTGKIEAAPWCLPLPRLRTATPLVDTLLKTKLCTLIALPEPLQNFRKRELDQMFLDFYHPFRSVRFEERRVAFTRKIAPASTPFRFALHRRYADWANIKIDVEETDAFDTLGSPSPDSYTVEQELEMCWKSPTRRSTRSIPSSISGSNSSDTLVDVTTDRDCDKTPLLLRPAFLRNGSSFACAGLSVEAPHFPCLHEMPVVAS